jgi:hypothetical protein
LPSFTDVTVAGSLFRALSIRVPLRECDRLAGPLVHHANTYRA